MAKRNSIFLSEINDALASSSDDMSVAEISNLLDADESAVRAGLTTLIMAPIRHYFHGSVAKTYVVIDAYSTSAEDRYAHTA